MLFRQSINNHEDGGEAFRRRKLLNEVHGYGVPWFLQYGELFQESERVVSGCLGMGTGCARTDVVLDKGADARPGIFPTDEFQGSVLPEVASCRVIIVTIFLLFHNLLLLVCSRRIHILFGMCRYNYVSLLLVVHPFHSCMFVL